MKFHKEGYPTLTLIILISAVLIVIAHFLLSDFAIALPLAIAISAFLLIMILQFFRSPNRQIQQDENVVLSPCDGKVVVIEETEEKEYLNEKRRQISIFMSPINVHNNRYPTGGILKYFKYHPGKYLVAWHPKSSTDNERTTIVVEDAKNRSILFRQIAGAMARRIVFYGKEGDQVDQGAECGFIKFGSRVDVMLPLDAKVEIEIDQKVVGGKTVIASFS